MAMGGLGNDDGPGRRAMLSDINVTPMVDVMLVLLIIFMVAAPMMTQGLEVDLPKVDASAMRSGDETVVITVTADGSLLLDGTPLPNAANLDAQVRQVMRTKGTEVIYLKADRVVPYGRVAAVMAALRDAGITNVGLVTDPADRLPSPGAPEAGPAAGAPADPAAPVVPAVPVVPAAPAGQGG